MVVAVVMVRRESGQRWRRTGGGMAGVGGGGGGEGERGGVEGGFVWKLRR